MQFSGKHTNSNFVKSTICKKDPPALLVVHPLKQSLLLQYIPEEEWEERREKGEGIEGRDGGEVGEGGREGGKEGREGRGGRRRKGGGEGGRMGGWGLHALFGNNKCTLKKKTMGL